MSKPFKFRYVRPITGIYVLACAAAVVLAIMYAARAQGLFAPRKELMIELPSSGSMGLTVGADVLMLGTPVGKITRVDINIVDYDAADGLPRRTVAEIRATARIEARFFKGIRTDSRAIVSKTLGIAGDSRVEITIGDGDPISEGGSITANADNGTSEAIERVLRRVEEVFVPTIEELHRTLEEARLAVTEFRDPSRELQQTLTSLRSVIDRLDKGEGLAGRVLRDETFAMQIITAVPKLNDSLDRLNVILGEVEQTTSQLPGLTRAMSGPLDKLPELVEQTKQTIRTVEELMVNVKAASGNLPEITAKVNKAATMLPSLLLQTETTLAEIDRLAEALQRSWLLNGTQNTSSQPPGFPTINPAAVSGSSTAPKSPPSGQQPLQPAGGR